MAHGHTIIIISMENARCLNKRKCHSFIEDSLKEIAFFRLLLLSSKVGLFLLHFLFYLVTLLPSFSFDSFVIDFK